MAKLGVDLSGVNPNDGVMGPLPAPGPYQFYLTEGEVKDTSTGSGTLFKFTAEVIEGEYKGRKVFDQINVTNKNPVAQKIGQAQLAGMIAACGLPPTTDDTDEILWQPFWAEVKIEPYKDKNGNDKEGTKFHKFLFETAEQSPPNTKPQPSAPPHANDNRQHANDNRQQPAQVKPNMPWKRPA